MIEFFKRNIFLRIYAGLIVICLAVALLAQSAMDFINTKRVASYREDMATSVFYLVAEGVARKQNEAEREYWLSDAGSLFGAEFNSIPMQDMQFTDNEISRLSNFESVVRYKDNNQEATIYQLIPNSNELVTATLTQVSEQQVRAMAIFLLDDLRHYESFVDKSQHLAMLSDKFPFNMAYHKVVDIAMDDDQAVRLRRNEVIVQLDNTSGRSSSFNVIVPTEMSDMAIIIGPVELFNWTPLQIVVGILLASLALISLGVYGLIRPLQRKLQKVQTGLTAMSDGDLDARVEIKGQDEVSQVGATFNSMAAHIKRLIDSQRELTRAVSHELRTPVARIRFAVDMLADTDDEESRHLQKEYIDEDIESLNGLIDEMLTYAKLEEGSPKLDWEMVNLKELVEQIVRETNALGKPITVVGNPPAMRVKAQADRRYLHRVVQNLAGNALRYADSKIIVSAGVKKGEAFVTVEDDGHGIPEEDRDKVFVPFTRLDDSRTRSTGGYGLGLSIVSRIAFWFNGKMSVDESPELKGARFTMRWPAKQISQAISADEMTQEQSEKILMERVETDV